MQLPPSRNFLWIFGEPATIFKFGPLGELNKLLDNRMLILIPPCFRLIIQPFLNNTPKRVTLNLNSLLHLVLIQFDGMTAVRTNLRFESGLRLSLVQRLVCLHLIAFTFGQLCLHPLVIFATLVGSQLVASTLPVQLNFPHVARRRLLTPAIFPPPLHLDFFLLLSKNRRTLEISLHNSNTTRSNQKLQKLYLTLSHILNIRLLMEDYYEQGELEEGQAVSQKEQSSEFIIAKVAGRKELCQVCGIALRKYTCPKCLKKSCGIACLNKHKKGNNCSGVADPFTSLSQKHINQKQVQKDYRFVKDMLSNADKVKRTLSGVQTFGVEPKRFKIMKINARKMHNINLQHAPPIIERHRENISFYFVKTKTFYWVVQILFWRQQHKKQICSRYVTSPLADSLTISQILPQTYLCKDLLELRINTQKKQQFSVFLEQKQSKSTAKIAQELDVNKTLAQCLANQTIYEFPTLIAVHNSLKQQYLSLRQPPQ